MKRFIAVFLLLSLCTCFLSINAHAADWPQFLGDELCRGVSAAYTPRTAADLSLRWEKRTGATDSTGAMSMSWYDIPGTPVTVGDYVYYYSSQYLRKLDLKTGEEVAKAQVYGKKVNQFFINIAYGDGKIFVPCQTNNMDDGTGVTGCFFRVFDAETMTQLYVTEKIPGGQMQSPVIYHDGYFVTGTYGRDSVYACFSASDDDISKTNEVKKAKWSVPSDSKYGFSFNGAVFVGDYCYYGLGSVLFCVNYMSGNVQTFDIGSGYGIHSTITYSHETDRLYVAATHPNGCASVKSYTLDTNGLPSAGSCKEWVSNVNDGGTQSTPVIYRGRMYIGGGGSTMGSAEPFHVVDAVTMKEIYSVPIITKGSAVVSTAGADVSNGYQVHIYMVPFAPNKNGSSELWIIKDSQDQVTAQYEIVENIGRAEYCSQSLLAASDGSLLWYNDAGSLYCFENITDYAPKMSDTEKQSFLRLAAAGILHGLGILIKAVLY